MILTGVKNTFSEIILPSGIGVLIVIDNILTVIS